MGSDAKNAFTHREFAVPEKQELTEMAKFFDLGITMGADTMITHTLNDAVRPEQQGGSLLSRHRADAGAGAGLNKAVV